MKEQNQLPKEKRQRLSVLIGDGLLTELDMSELLDLSINKIVELIDEGRLPGRRIGYKGERVRTLTSIKDFIKWVEGAKEGSK